MTPDEIADLITILCAGLMFGGVIVLALEAFGIGPATPEVD